MKWLLLLFPIAALAQQPAPDSDPMSKYQRLRYPFVLA